MGKFKDQEPLTKELKTVKTDAISVCKEITPEWAKFMLDNHNDCNRTLYKDTARRYASSMERGLWLRSGEPIIISDKGNILNGQHRLLAVYYYGKTMEMYVLEGIDQATFAVMDSHSKRSCGQVLKILEVPDPTLVASILKLVSVYTTDKTMANITSKYASNDQIIYEYEKHPLVAVSALLAKPKKMPAGMTSSVFGFCHYVCARIDKEDADFFYRQITEAELIKKGDPAYTVLKICNKNFRENIRPTQKDRVILFFKAWNHFRRGEQAYRINTSLGVSDKFPRLR